MSGDGPVDLPALPGQRRREALAEVVTEEFRAVLDLPADAEFPRDAGFFDLGMTSLRLTEIRQRLTRRLGRDLRDETLFSHATLDSLLDHLVEVLDGEPPGEPARPAQGPPAQLDDLLAQLYR